MRSTRMRLTLMKSTNHFTLSLAVLVSLLAAPTARLLAQEQDDAPRPQLLDPDSGDRAADNPRSADDPNVLELKFFFFDSGKVEWIVSSDKKYFVQHLQNNEDSSQLVSTLREAVLGPDQSGVTRQHIADWIADERANFEQRGVSPVRFRKAEGIVAYLRAHDFDVQELVAALKDRSGASDVEIVGIHQVDAGDDSTFQLKVVLVDPTLDIGKRGFNVKLSSSKAGYLSVVYALASALYDVEELIGTREPPETLPSPDRTVDQDSPLDLDAAIRDFQ